MALNLKLAVGALVLGIGAGGAAAVIIPSAESASVDGEFAAPSEPLRQAPAGKRERGPQGTGQSRLTAEPGTLQVLLRQPDPAGGAPWLIRGFDARNERRGTSGKLQRCVQLGREVDGQFGWIDGDHVFRPVSVRSRTGTPNQCRAARAGGGFGPTLKLATLLDRPSSADPAVRGSVLWGTVDASTSPAVLQVNGRTRQLSPMGRRGAFLEFFGPAQPVVGARLHEGSARGRAIATVTRDRVPNAPSVPERRRTGLRLDTAQILARAPDPGGGPSWAVTGVARTGGGWCTGLMGSLIGTHVGELELRLGLLLEAPPNRGWTECRKSEAPSADWPVSLIPTSGRYSGAANVDRGVAEQRLLPGRTILWGRAMASVASVTIRTPRDVRTLEPSGPAHGLIAVYDGSFPRNASADLTVRFRDGTTKKMNVPVGMFW